jgi:hypothetical protein
MADKVKYAMTAALKSIPEDDFVCCFQEHIFYL